MLIELTHAQIEEVMRTAGDSGSMSVLLAALRDAPGSPVLGVAGWAQPAQLEDRRLSRSLLSGLLVLFCFSPDGGYLGIGDIARMLDMNTSTAHRYVSTLYSVGLLERDPELRKYRLAGSPEPEAMWSV